MARKVARAVPASDVDVVAQHRQDLQQTMHQQTMHRWDAMKTGSRATAYVTGAILPAMGGPHG